MLFVPFMAWPVMAWWTAWHYCSLAALSTISDDVGTREPAAEVIPFPAAAMRRGRGIRSGGATVVALVPDGPGRS